MEQDAKRLKMDPDELVLPQCLNSSYGICIPSVEKGLSRYGPLSDEYNFLYDNKDEMSEILEDIESSNEFAKIVNLGFLSIKYTESSVTYKQFFVNTPSPREYPYLSSLAKSTMKSRIGLSTVYERLNEEKKLVVDNYMKIWIKKIIQDYIIHTRSTETRGEFYVSLNLTQRLDSAIGFHKDFYPFCNYFTLTYLTDGETIGPSIRSDMLKDGNFTTSSIIVGKLTTMGWTNGIKRESYHSSPIRASSINFRGSTGTKMHESSERFDEMSNELVSTVSLRESMPKLVPNPFLSTIDESFIPHVDNLIYRSGLGWRNFLRVLYLDSNDITPYIIGDLNSDRIEFEWNIKELDNQQITYIELEDSDSLVHPDPLVHPKTSHLFLGGGNTIKLVKNEVFEILTRPECREYPECRVYNISILNDIFGGKSKSKKSKSKKSKPKKTKSKKSKRSKGSKSKKLMRFF